MIATVVALVGAFNAPVPSHSVSRVSDVTMGARKGASSIGKRGVSTKTGSQGFIDVTGAKYQEVDSFVARFDEIGVLPPIGRWDPLQIREQGPERYRRFVEMEIKHGRLAMAAFLGVITTYSGVRWPGYLSKAEGIQFSDLPGGAISSWAALPTASWLQIVIFVSFCEVYLPEAGPGEAGGRRRPGRLGVARYPDGYDIWLGDGSTKQVGIRRSRRRRRPPAGRRRRCSPPPPAFRLTRLPPPSPFRLARRSSSSARRGSSTLSATTAARR